MKKSLIYKLLILLLTIALIPSSILLSKEINNLVSYDSFNIQSFIYLLLVSLFILGIVIIIFILLIKVIGGNKND